MTSKRETIRRALILGPAFSEDVATATGFGVRTVSATLHWLWTHGDIERTAGRVSREGRTSAYLYSLRHKEWRFWTTPEIKRLKAMSDRTPQEVAKALGRTVPSIRHQAKRLGVTFANAAEARMWPVETRMAVVQLRVAGKTYREIADQLGVPLGTVKQWSPKMFPGLSSSAPETRTTPGLPYHPPSEDNA